MEQEIKVRESRGSDYLLLKRVFYAKENISKELREYSLNGFTPVGTINEWKEIAKNAGFLGLRLLEKDGSMEFVIFGVGDD